MHMLARKGIPSDIPKAMCRLRTAAHCLLGIGLLSLALNGCGMLQPSSAPSSAPEVTGRHPVVDSGVLHALRRQIRERDKRITELESKLEAFKVIEHDMREWQKSARERALAPATLDRRR